MANRANMAKQRLTQWDFLRALAMFLVVAIHSTPYLTPVRGFNIGGMVAEIIIICDPIFFALSGYFAIRELKGSYITYLWKKFLTISLPLLVYGTLLYFYAIRQGETTLSAGNLIRWWYQLISGGWWFAGALIPFLMLAPWLYKMFESLDTKQLRRLFLLVSVAMVWGIIVTSFSSMATWIQREGLITLINTISILAPPQVVPGSYFVYFCLGYFVKRLPELFSEKTLRRLCEAGLVLWLLGGIASAYGYQREDPSYLWFFTTIALFHLFDKIRITAAPMQKGIAFVAHRSYSIYLFNYVSINFVFSRLQARGLLVPEIPMPFALRLPLWITAVIGTYCLTLLVSTICDYVLLKPCQAACNMVFGGVCGFGAPKTARQDKTAESDKITGQEVISQNKVVPHE